MKKFGLNDIFALIRERGYTHYLIFSTGCKINWAAWQILKVVLDGFGMENLEENEAKDIDNEREKETVAFVFSCAVTKRAMSDVRRTLRKALSRADLVVLTGCVSEGELLEGMEFEKKVIYSREVGELFWNLSVSQPLKLSAELPVRMPFIIQLGCNRRCTYCYIPFARGKERSASFESLMRLAEWYGKNGVKELILSGTRLVSWQDGEKKLIDLVKTLIKLGFFVRLSSFEPFDLKQEDWLFEILEEKMVAKHVHLAFQHTSPKVLRDMNRPELSRELELLNELREKFADIFLSADFIVGFPTETDEDFEKLISDIERMPLSDFHPFRYSPRERTKAATLKPVVPDRVVKERMRRIVELREKKLESYKKSLVGKSFMGLVVATDWVILSNYIALKLKEKVSKVGEFVVAKIYGIGEYGKRWMHGEIVWESKKSECR